MMRMTKVFEVDMGMCEQERLYTAVEVADILKTTRNNVLMYRKRYGIGCIKHVPGISRGKIHFSESDIDFIRSKLGKKGRKSKPKESTEYEKFIASFPCRLLTAKELSAVMGISETRVTDFLDIYAVIVPQRSRKATGKNKKFLWLETDIPKMQEDLAAVSRRAGGRKRVSGMTYENSPERLAEIKAKYANGVPAGEIEKWLGVRE